MEWMLIVCALTVSAAPAADLPAALAREADGDLPGSLVALEQVVALRPGWELARIELARVLMRSGGSLERAALHLETANALAPENPRAHFLRGAVLEELGRRDEAARAYETSLAYRASYADPHRRLAALALGREDWRAAERHARALTELLPDDLQARFQLAEAFEGQSRTAEAERELLRLHQQQPGSATVARRLAAFYERTGRAAQAARVLDRLRAPVPRQMRPLPASRK